MKRNTLLAILFLPAAGVFLYLLYLGFFSKITVQSAVKGPYHIAYVEYTGPYSGVGPSFELVEKYLRDEGVGVLAHAGMYFDNPEYVAESKLRSHAGAVISEKDYSRLQLQKKGDFLLKILPQSEYVFTRFPFKNFLSIFLGIYRVYPALNEFAKNLNYKPYRYKETGYEDSFIMEIYYSDRIEYLMNLPSE